MLKQARASGQLNLSRKGLSAIPESVWRINVDAGVGQDVIIGDKSDGDRWWDQQDLQKLVIASNSLAEIGDGIAELQVGKGCFTAA